VVDLESILSTLASNFQGSLQLKLLMYYNVALGLYQQKQNNKINMWYLVLSFHSSHIIDYKIQQTYKLREHYPVLSFQVQKPLYVNFLVSKLAYKDKRQNLGWFQINKCYWSFVLMLFQSEGLGFWAESCIY
jgi:hypothetical protein